MRGRVGVDPTGLATHEGSWSVVATSWLARGFAASSWTVGVNAGVGSAVEPDISQSMGKDNIARVEWGPTSKFQ